LPILLRTLILLLPSAFPSRLTPHRKAWRRPLLRCPAGLSRILTGPDGPSTRAKGKRKATWNLNVLELTVFSTETWSNCMKKNQSCTICCTYFTYEREIISTSICLNSLFAWRSDPSARLCRPPSIYVCIDKPWSNHILRTRPVVLGSLVSHN
jgi:hypothetical protein